MSRLVVLAAFLPLLALAGCAHAPHAFLLPTTAAVRAPLQAAQGNLARAAAIDRHEQSLAADVDSRGVKAGSEEARELESLAIDGAKADAGAQAQLAAAVSQADVLDQEQKAAQARLDALARHDTAATARAAKLAKDRYDLTLFVIFLFAADFVAGAPIQRGLHWLADLIGRVILAFAAHLVAFWPVLLALV